MKERYSSFSQRLGIGIKNQEMLSYNVLHGPGLVIAACFALLALLLSIVLIIQHLRSYSNPDVCFSPFLAILFSLSRLDFALDKDNKMQLVNTSLLLTTLKLGS